MYVVIRGGTIGKPVIHSEDLATDLVWIDILCYGLDDARKLAAGNREFLAEVVHDLDEDPAVGPALV